MLAKGSKALLKNTITVTDIFLNSTIEDTKNKNTKVAFIKNLLMNGMN